MSPTMLLTGRCPTSGRRLALPASRQSPPPRTIGEPLVFCDSATNSPHRLELQTLRAGRLCVAWLPACSTGLIAFVVPTRQPTLPMPTSGGSFIEHMAQSARPSCPSCSGMRRNGSSVRFLRRINLATRRTPEAPFRSGCSPTTRRLLKYVFIALDVSVSQGATLAEAAPQRVL